MAKSKKSIRQMAEETYGKGELADAVVKHAEQLGTTKKIENGQLVLPHPQDAQQWLDRCKELAGKDEEESE